MSSVLQHPARQAVTDTVAAKVRQLVAASAECDPADVRPGARLIDDLGVDSLEMASLLVDIEIHFGVVVTATQLATVETVADLVAAVGVAGPAAPP